MIQYTPSLMTRTQWEISCVGGMHGGSRVLLDEVALVLTLFILFIVVYDLLFFSSFELSKIHVAYAISKAFNS